MLFNVCNDDVVIKSLLYSTFTNIHVPIAFYFLKVLSSTILDLGFIVTASKIGGSPSRVSGASETPYDAQYEVTYLGISMGLLSRMASLNPYMMHKDTTGQSIICTQQLMENNDVLTFKKGSTSLIIQLVYSDNP